MARSISFVFNVEPTGKGRPRGRVAMSRTTGHQYVQEYTPARTAHVEQAIRAQVKAEACGEFFEAGVPLRLDAEFIMAKPPSVPKRRAHPVTKPDLDNCYKLLTDALERFLYSNDAQIVDAHVRKSYGATPCIRVTVEELTSFAADCAAIIRKRPAPQEALL